MHSFSFHNNFPYNSFKSWLCKNVARLLVFNVLPRGKELFYQYLYVHHQVTIHRVSCSLSVSNKGPPFENRLNARTDEVEEFILASVSSYYHTAQQQELVLFKCQGLPGSTLALGLCFFWSLCSCCDYRRPCCHGVGVWSFLLFLEAAGHGTHSSGLA